MALESGGFQPHKDYRGFVPAQQFYAALVAKGFTPVAARGILGNAMHESGGGSHGVYLDPPTDAGHPNWGTGDAAVGAIQWEGKRQSGVSPTLQSQVDKIWDEFNNPGSAGMSQGAFERLQSARSPGEAAHLVNTIYERPLAPAASDAQRQRFANVSLSPVVTEFNKTAASVPGITLTSTPAPVPEPGIGSGIPTPAQPNPTAVAAQTPPPAAPQNAGDWVKKFVDRPPPTKDAQGNEVQGKSPLENLTGAIPGKPAGQQQAAAPNRRHSPQCRTQWGRWRDRRGSCSPRF